MSNNEFTVNYSLMEPDMYNISIDMTEDEISEAERIIMKRMDAIIFDEFFKHLLVATKPA